ncbi:MAG: NAD(P)H-dependent oxidoreductase [Spirochaetales bacterium]|nr:NAD(P)H-dependent oxidoreductase [Spirochaetales bacterium]
MDVQVILCHPLPGSFNHVVAERVTATLVEQGHAPRLHDLYAEGFDPVLPPEELRRGVSFDARVLEHAEELAACGGLVAVHPDWWGLPPALMKGWVDRIFRPGVAYEFEGEEFLRKRKVPLLSGKRALVFACTDTTAEEDPGVLEAFWRQAVFAYCGLEGFGIHVLRDMHHLEPADRTAWLRLVADTVRLCFPRS